jgi:hypothetical protein
MLINLGLNITGDFLSDLIKQIFSKSNKYTKQEFIQQLSPYLKIENADIYAEKIINFLAKEGDIEIADSYIYAKKAVHYSSNQNASFSLKNSVSQSENTSVDTLRGNILGKNGAQINQYEDSIDFLLTNSNNSEINIFNSTFLIKKKI